MSCGAPGTSGTPGANSTDRLVEILACDGVWDACDFCDSGDPGAVGDDTGDTGGGERGPDCRHRAVLGFLTLNPGSVCPIRRPPPGRNEYPGGGGTGNRAWSPPLDGSSTGRGPGLISRKVREDSDPALARRCRELLRPPNRDEVGRNVAVDPETVEDSGMGMVCTVAAEAMEELDSRRCMRLVVMFSTAVRGGA